MQLPPRRMGGLREGIVRLVPRACEGVGNMNRMPPVHGSTELGPSFHAQWHYMAEPTGWDGSAVPPDRNFRQEFNATSLASPGCVPSSTGERVHGGTRSGENSPNAELAQSESSDGDQETKGVEGGLHVRDVVRGYQVGGYELMGE